MEKDLSASAELFKAGVHVSLCKRSKMGNIWANTVPKKQNKKTVKSSDMPPDANTALGPRDCLYRSISA